MSPRTYAVYLSTLASGQNAPLNKTNLANVQWNINWEHLFKEEKDSQKCFVRCRMVSQSSTNVDNHDNFIGSLRIQGYSSPYCYEINGVPIGEIQVNNDVTVAGDHYLLTDTSNDFGVMISKPSQNKIFNICFINLSGNFMTNVPEYHITLLFDFY